MSKIKRAAFISLTIFLAEIGVSFSIDQNETSKLDSSGAINVPVPPALGTFPRMADEIRVSVGFNGKRIYEGTITNPGSEIFSVTVSFKSFNENGNLIDESSTSIEGHPCPGHQGNNNCVEPGETIPFRIETNVPPEAVAKYYYSISTAEEEWGMEHTNESGEGSPEE